MPDELGGTVGVTAWRKVVPPGATNELPPPPAPVPGEGRPPPHHRTHPRRHRRPAVGHDVLATTGATAPKPPSIAREHALTASRIAGDRVTARIGAAIAARGEEAAAATGAIRFHRRPHSRPRRPRSAPPAPTSWPSPRSPRYGRLRRPRGDEDTGVESVV